MLSNMLTKQTINHEHHDTQVGGGLGFDPGTCRFLQVTIHECVSRSIHVRNSHTDVFARSGVDAAVQRTHHWSPLLKVSCLIFLSQSSVRGLGIFPELSE